MRRKIESSETDKPTSCICAAQFKFYYCCRISFCTNYINAVSANVRYSDKPTWCKRTSIFRAPTIGNRGKYVYCHNFHEEQTSGEIPKCKHSLSSHLVVSVDRDNHIFGTISPVKAFVVMVLGHGWGPMRMCGDNKLMQSKINRPQC